MVGPMVKGFRMGHQPENTAGGITYPGDIIDAAVGIVWKPAFGRPAVGRGIPGHNLVVFYQPCKCALLGIKFSFTVSYWKFRQIDSNGKNTWGCRIDF